MNNITLSEIQVYNAPNTKLPEYPYWVVKCIDNMVWYDSRWKTFEDAATALACPEYFIIKVEN